MRNGLAGFNLNEAALYAPRKYCVRNEMTEQANSIEFAGDNPCVVLYDCDRTIVSAISYWRSSASLSGIGEVLFLLRRSPGRPLEAIVFGDNTELAAFLCTFNQHFEGFQTIGLDGAMQPAKFHTRRASGSAQLECVAPMTTIRVEWSELGTPRMNRSDILDFGRQVGRSYEVSSVIVPANSGSIVIDDERQPGRVIDGYGALPKSAFLAFCETWTRLGSDTP